MYSQNMITERIQTQNLHFVGFHLHEVPRISKLTETEGQMLEGGSVVKNLPALQEAWIQSLGWEDTLEKKMATHSSILAWEIP